MIAEAETRRDAESRRRRLRARPELWGLLTLSSVVALSAAAIWHLIRRGRLLRASLSPPRPSSRRESPRVDPS